MRQHSNKDKVRLSVDCTEEQRMHIKVLAAQNRMTISEFLLDPINNMMRNERLKNETNKK